MARAAHGASHHVLVRLAATARQTLLSTGAFEPASRFVQPSPTHTRLRSWLQILYINCRMLGHGEPIRVKAGRARSVSHFERQRHRNSQPRFARPLLPSYHARRKPGPESCACSRFMARHCGAYFGHRRYESPRCVGSWAISRTTTVAMAKAV
jgi:hypothetical protein